MGAGAGKKLVLDHIKGLQDAEQQEEIAKQLRARSLHEAPPGGPTINAPAPGQPMGGPPMALNAPNPNTVRIGSSTGGRSYTPNPFNSQQAPIRPPPAVNPPSPPRPIKDGVRPPPTGGPGKSPMGPNMGFGSMVGQGTGIPGMGAPGAGMPPMQPPKPAMPPQNHMMPQPGGGQNPMMQRQMAVAQGLRQRPIG